MLAARDGAGRDPDIAIRDRVARCVRSRNGIVRAIEACGKMPFRSVDGWPSERPPLTVMVSGAEVIDPTVAVRFVVPAISGVTRPPPVTPPLGAGPVPPGMRPCRTLHCSAGCCPHNHGLVRQLRHPQRWWANRRPAYSCRCRSPGNSRTWSLRLDPPQYRRSGWQCYCSPRSWCRHFVAVVVEVVVSIIYGLRRQPIHEAASVGSRLGAVADHDIVCHIAARCGEYHTAARVRENQVARNVAAGKRRRPAARSRENAPAARSPVDDIVGDRGVRASRFRDDAVSQSAVFAQEGTPPGIEMS